MNTGALSGSREPKQLAGSALSGFDPARIAFGEQLLADKGLDPLAVASHMSAAQLRALKTLAPQDGWVRLPSLTASEIGTSGRTLFEMNDLWRDERGCEAPIMLVHGDVDDGPWGISRVWQLSSEGEAVLYAIADGSPKGRDSATGSISEADDSAGRSEAEVSPND